jgi:hypothetical protein
MQKLNAFVKLQHDHLGQNWAMLSRLSQSFNKYVKRS